MPDSAKNSTSRLKLEDRPHGELVRAARKHARNGGKPAEFSQEHGLARTTVIGWCNGEHVGPRGRPRKLVPFNETAILKVLATNQGMQTWKTVRECIQKQSSEILSKRSVLRLQESWGLTAETAKAGEPMFIHVTGWSQPPETIDGKNPGLRATIWRLLNGRGMECFLMTDDDSDAALEKVAAAVMERFGDRKKRRQLRTNHPGLARACPRIGDF